MSGSEIVSLSSEFDLFAPKPIKMSVMGKLDVVYKPIAPVGQNNL